ncbi:unannotated protein [freshwater metagenome]|uniref:Unannotated protein n=1 Tax=freshwater metagenome TaxID=449393 RepID=A0A6J6YWL7_9ZZZZ
MMDLSSLLYIACLFLFVFGVFNGTSRDKSKIKKSAIKAIALVAIALIIVAFI